MAATQGNLACPLHPADSHHGLAVTDVLALSAERDQYERRIRAAYDEGYAAGRTDASLWNAQLFSDEQAEAQWREWNRNLNLDRRDQALIRQLEDKRERYWRTRNRDDKPNHSENVVLYFAEHPGSRFDADPRMQPHGSTRHAEVVALAAPRKGSGDRAR